MREQQGCCGRGLAGFSRDAENCPPGPRRIVVRLQNEISLPVHQFECLTDQSALGTAAVGLDPTDDSLAKTLPLVVGWHVRSLRHRYFPPAPTATFRKSRCASAASRCTRPGHGPPAGGPKA